MVFPYILQLGRSGWDNLVLNSGPDSLEVPRSVNTHLVISKEYKQTRWQTFIEENFVVATRTWI